MTREEIMRLVKGKDGFIGSAMNIPQDKQTEVEAIVWDYNQTRPTDYERQRELLRKILGTYNDQVIIKPGIHFDFGFNTHFLGMAFVNFNVTILDTSPVTIGNGCFIAPGVVISCASHPIHSAIQTSLMAFVCAIDNSFLPLTDIHALAVSVLCTMTCCCAYLERRDSQYPFILSFIAFKRLFSYVVTSESTNKGFTPSVKL